MPLLHSLSVEASLKEINLPHRTRLGQPLLLSGALLNTLAMIPVTVMVEDRMRRKPERVEAFQQYCARTSVWVPWWPAAGRKSAGFER